MTLYAIWSLRRGVINPPEPVPDAPEVIAAIDERDPAMTIEEWGQLEGYRCGYIYRKLPKREKSIVTREGRVA